MIQEIPGFKKKTEQKPIFKGPGPMGMGGPGKGPMKMSLAGLGGAVKAGPSPMKALFS
jgi:hypothetical protein